MVHDFFTVLTMIVVVTAITTVVVNGTGSGTVISDFFNGFSSSLSAAQGK